MEEKEDNQIIQEFKQMTSEQIIQEAEKMLKPFQGKSRLKSFTYSSVLHDFDQNLDFPYCKIKPGRPLSELNLAFMENDSVRILMEKEAALAASLDTLKNLSEQFKILIGIKNQKIETLARLQANAQNN